MTDEDLHLDVLQDLHLEVHRLVGQVLAAAGSAPGVGTEAWWAAPTDAKIAGLLLLSEAWVTHDPERLVTDRLKAAAVVISQALDWSDVACNHQECAHTAHHHLVRRRGEPGPLARSFNAAAAARWVATGRSEESAA